MRTTTKTTIRPTLGVARDANPVKKKPERANAKGMTGYNSIPFKNRDIDRLQRKSAEQFKAENDAKRVEKTGKE
jgi:hypothetical protein